MAQHCGVLLAERRTLIEESRTAGLTRSGERRALGTSEALRIAGHDDLTTQVQSPGTVPVLGRVPMPAKRR